MWLKVQTLAGVEAGYINLDNIDRIVLVDSGTIQPNQIEVLGISGIKDFKVSKSASIDLMQYLDRYGLS